jgi:hypothetical protein
LGIGRFAIRRFFEVRRCGGFPAELLIGEPVEVVDLGGFRTEREEPLREPEREIGTILSQVVARELLERLLIVRIRLEFGFEARNRDLRGLRRRRRQRSG